MKTKVILATIIILLTVTNFKANASNADNLVCLKNYIPKLLQEEMSTWDMSALETKQVSAEVSFQVDKDGNIHVYSIDTDDVLYASILKSNMEKLQIENCTPELDKIFTITLKYKRS